MTRVFAILFLNIWHTVPHRLSGSAITILVAVSALTVSGAVFADSSPQANSPFTTHHSSVLQTTHSSLSPSTLPVLHHSSVRHPDAVASNSNANTNTQTQSTTQSQTPSTNTPSPTSTTNESDTAGGSSTAPSQSAALQLAQVQTTCSQGQTTYSITNAVLSTVSALDAGSTVTYNWETKIDSGTAPTTPPINSTPVTQTVSTSSSSITLSASDSTEPLLTTTSSENYVYEFRLVVGGPINATSAWVSVPESTTSC